MDLPYFNDPQVAAWARHVQEQLGRLGRHSITGPQGMLTGSSGIALREAPGPQPILLKTGTSGTYPPIGDLPTVYPAYEQDTIAFSDASDTNTISATTKLPCFVCNLAGPGNYIPTGTFILAIPVFGTDTSKLPHYLTYTLGSPSYINLNGPYTSSFEGDCTTGDLTWNGATDLAGFSTSDSISFTIPDNSQYLATFCAPIHLGSGSATLTYPAFDGVEAKVELYIDGSPVSPVAGGKVGFEVIYNVNTLSWSYVDMGSQTISLSYIFSGKKSKLLKCHLLTTGTDGVGGSGDFTAIKFYAGPVGSETFGGNLTVAQCGIAIA